jgi:hypothetical protein
MDGPSSLRLTENLLHVHYSIYGGITAAAHWAATHDPGETGTMI